MASVPASSPCSKYAKAERGQYRPRKVIEEPRILVSILDELAGRLLSTRSTSSPLVLYEVPTDDPVLYEMGSGRRPTAC